jgi:hypothetical protein
MDFTGGRLQAQRKIDRRGHRRPHAGHKAALARYEEIVIDPHGDIRRHIGVAGPVLGDPFHIGAAPASIRELLSGQPLIGLAGLRQKARDGEPHGGLHVIPRVGLLAFAPGNLPARPLRPGNQGGGRHNIDRLPRLGPKSVQVEFHVRFRQSPVTFNPASYKASRGDASG